MKSIVFSGIAVTALAFASSPAAASDSIAPQPANIAVGKLDMTVNGAKGGGMKMRGGGMKMRGGKGMRGMKMHGGKGMRGMKMRGHRKFNRGGFRGGFVGFYQRPYYGFSLPSYWIAPSFGIANYGTFGLSAPQPGYSWSRYYDDAVLRDQRGMVYDYRQNIDWSQGGGAYAPNGYYHDAGAEAEYGPSISADRGVYGWGEETYNAPAPEGPTERGVYDGAWTGQYVDPENRVYRGEWQGTYTNEQGKVYQGTYRGTSIGDPVYRAGTGHTAVPYPRHHAPKAVHHAPKVHHAAPAPHATTYPAPAYPQAPAYQTPHGFESYERCLKGRGVKGGVIGAVIGAVAGNRIAGRGNRLEGSLIGGGIGALAGLGIEKALDKCERFLPVPQRPVAHGPAYPAPAPRYPVAQRPAYHQVGYGWSSGYYWVPGGYYHPPQQTTVTIIPGSTTTTTTTEYVYEDVYVKRPGKRLVKPKSKRLRKPGCRC